MQYLIFYDNLSCWGHLFICHNFQTFRITHRMALLNLCLMCMYCKDRTSKKNPGAVANTRTSRSNTSSSWWNEECTFIMCIHPHTDTTFGKVTSSSPCSSLCFHSAKWLLFPYRQMKANFKVALNTLWGHFNDCLFRHSYTSKLGVLIF